MSKFRVAPKKQKNENIDDVIERNRGRPHFPSVIVDKLQKLTTVSRIMLILVFSSIHSLKTGPRAMIGWVGWAGWAGWSGWAGLGWNSMFLLAFRPRCELLHKKTKN